MNCQWVKVWRWVAFLDWSVYFYSLLFIWGGPPHPSISSRQGTLENAASSDVMVCSNCAGDGWRLHYLSSQVTGISAYRRRCDGLGLWGFLYYQWRPMFTYPSGTREDHRVSKPPGPSVWAVQWNENSLGVNICFVPMSFFQNLESNEIHTHSIKLFFFPEQSSY